MYGDRDWRILTGNMSGTPTGMLHARFNEVYLKRLSEGRDFGIVCEPMVKMFFIWSNIICTEDWVILYEEWRETRYFRLPLL